LSPTPYKEIKFFHRYYDKGINWYRSQFGRPGIPFDVTPGYMIQMDRKVPDRIQEHYPGATIVFLLREPVERAISSWYHHHQHKPDSWVYEVGIKKYFDQALKKLIANGPIVAKQAYTGMVRGGIYVPFLKEWAKRFDPQQIIVYFSEEFFASPSAVATDLLKRLQVSTNIKSEWYRLSRKNKSPKHAAGCNAKVRRKLRDYYRPYNQELRELLGRDLPDSWQY